MLEVLVILRGICPVYFVCFRLACHHLHSLSRKVLCSVRCVVREDFDRNRLLHGPQVKETLGYTGVD